MRAKREKRMNLPVWLTCSSLSHRGLDLRLIFQSPDSSFSSGIQILGLRRKSATQGSATSQGGSCEENQETTNAPASDHMLSS